jgi:hypothetical protein
MCITQTLTSLQTLIGTLNLNQNNVVAIAGSRQKGFPSNIICSNCMKGAFSITNAELPGEISQSDMDNAKSTCGDSFVGMLPFCHCFPKSRLIALVDGGIPPSLIQTAVGATPVAPEAPPATSQSPPPPVTSAPVNAAPAPSQPPKKKSSALGRSSGARVAFSALVLVSTAVAYLA